MENVKQWEWIQEPFIDELVLWGGGNRGEQKENDEGQVVQRRSGAQGRDTSWLAEAESFFFARLLSNIGQSLPLALRGHTLMVYQTSTTAWYCSAQEGWKDE